MGEGQEETLVRLKNSMGGRGLPRGLSRQGTIGKRGRERPKPGKQALKGGTGTKRHDFQLGKSEKPLTMGGRQGKRCLPEG